LNSKRLTTTIIVFTIIISSFLLSVRALDVQATLDSDPKDEITAQGTEAAITKLIYKSGVPYVYYRSHVGDTFQVTIEIDNQGVLPFFNVSITSPEANMTGNFPEYNEDWFEFSGEMEKNYTTILPGLTESITYFVTPKHQGNFTFTSSMVNYTYNGTNDYSISEDITFIVYKTVESIVVQKFLVIDSVEYQDGRSAVEKVIQIKLKITNFFDEAVNLSIVDTAPGDNETFTFNETLLTRTHDLLETNKTYSGFSYDLEPLIEGNYILPKCTVGYTFQNGTTFYNDSNTLTFEVFTPIYDGPDWTQKIPLLSVEKFFIYNDKKLTTLTITNNTLEPIMIQINVTNHGIVMAENLFIYEDSYSDWVFDTRGLEVWNFVNLSIGQSFVVNYTVTPKILGTFNIERTEVLYDFQNQYDLLMEEGYTIYSNIIVITIEVFEEQPSYTQQWWIAIGISFGIIIFAVIPTIVTFVTYGRRKKIQKGT